jgi:N-methylhydantoinase B/oxoprolinase/acetone carboxylase alpha subunit
MIFGKGDLLYAKSPGGGGFWAEQKTEVVRKIGLGAGLFF